MPAGGERAPIRIGCSGWNYAHWRNGVFYPPRLPAARWLDFYAQHFDTVEVNSTFYRLPRRSSVARWAVQSPPGFVFAVKGSRYITHMLKLRDAEIPLANFFASGLLALGSKMGPVLWQLPPQAPFDRARFAAFLDLLPRTTKEAARLAKKHDARLAGIAWTRTEADRPIRHAIEPRHASFFTPTFVRLLRKHRVALVFADTAGVFPYAEDLTAEVKVWVHADAESRAAIEAFKKGQATETATTEE